ncbi:hypothetical protein EJ08DRAFT_649487 [Tothia fuscella]|uniref:DUF7918 domain-containing protein n=1 Tax=Tothia fuscella TaxID=1048955 RepID=A0A9P4TYV1_9PEZI|nr:hypothetical protein EJ08DRAFT_649487 [Tothia fuscella]
MGGVDQFPGLSVQILVNGVPREEHPEPNDAQADGRTTCVRYIEAVSGANFAIRVKFESRFQYRHCDFCASIYLDGVLAKKPLWLKTELAGVTHGSPNIRDIEGVESISGNSWNMSKFLFADLDSNDSSLQSLDKDLKDRLEDLGEIKICLRRVKVTSKNEDYQLDRTPGLTNNATIPEKALKGRSISHSTSLARGVPSEKPNVFNCQDIDTETSPFAVFKFKYRSLRDLQAECIIPRSPTPLPLEERPIESLTAKEIRERLRRQEAALAEARAVRVKSEFKREHAATGLVTPGEDDDDIEVVEPRPKRSRVIETIDLT